MKRFLTVLLVAVVVAVSAGCGGDDEAGVDEATSEPGGAPITKAEFVEEANRICVEAEAALDDVQEPESMEEAVQLFEDRLIPSLRQQVDRIRDLGFPEADREQLDDLFDRTEEALDEFEADIEGALDSQEDPFAEVTDELAEYGLDECAS